MAIFLAELGDKTQLATMTMAASHNARWTIFCASAAALVCSSAAAVLVGEVVGRFLPMHVLQRGAGAVFIVLGCLYLFGAHD